LGGNDYWKDPIVPVDRIHCTQFEADETEATEAEVDQLMKDLESEKPKKSVNKIVKKTVK